MSSTNPEHCVGVKNGMPECVSNNPEMTDIGPACVKCLMLELNKKKKIAASFAQQTSELLVKSKVDNLTKVFNRASFDETINEHLEQGNPFGLIFIDINKFKTVNDKLGHVIGDVMLFVTAQYLSEQTREEDAVVSRFGGDEFCIILADSQGNQRRDNSMPLDERLNVVMNRLKNNYTTHPEIYAYNLDSDEQNRLGLAIGGAVWRPGMDREELINLADPKHRSVQ